MTTGGHTRNGSTVVSAPFLGWRDVELSDLLTHRAGLPTVVDDDVVALTEAQHWFGGGRGPDRFALVAVGAGVGDGLVVHDRVVRAADVDLGVVGAHRFDDCGPLAPTGRRGTIAAYLAADSVCASVAAVLRRPVTYDEVLDLAEAGEVVSRRVVDEAGRALGRLVASIASMAMTERVLLSGEGIAVARVAHAALLDGIAQSRPSWAPPLVLDVVAMDFSEWARGAAVIALRTTLLGPG